MFTLSRGSRNFRVKLVFVMFSDDFAERALNLIIARAYVNFVACRWESAAEKSIFYECTHAMPCECGYEFFNRSQWRDNVRCRACFSCKLRFKRNFKAPCQQTTCNNYIIMKVHVLWFLKFALILWRIQVLKETLQKCKLTFKTNWKQIFQSREKMHLRIGVELWLKIFKEKLFTIFFCKAFHVFKVRVLHE